MELERLESVHLGFYLALYDIKHKNSFTSVWLASENIP